MTTIKNLLNNNDKKQKVFYDEKILAEPAINANFIEENVWLNYQRTDNKLELIQKTNSIQNAQILIIESNEIKNLKVGSMYQGKIITSLIENRLITIQLKSNGRIVIIRKENK